MGFQVSFIALWRLVKASLVLALLAESESGRKIMPERWGFLNRNLRLSNRILQVCKKQIGLVLVSE